MMDNQNKPNGNKNNKPDENKPPLKMFRILIYILLGISFLNVLSILNGGNNIEVRYDEFKYMVEHDYVKSVEVASDRIYLNVDEDKLETINSDANITSLNPEVEEPVEEDSTILRAPSLPTQAEAEITKYTKVYTGNIKDDNLVEYLDANEIEYSQQVINSNIITDTLVEFVLPLVLMYLVLSVIFYFFSKKMGGDGGGIMGIGKSNHKVYKEDVAKIKFTDVAGQDEAKESLQEIVDYLHSPDKYREIGAKQPKGALLVGPPGTGKTLLAKAVAGEAGVTYFSISGSEFVEMYVGVGAKRVRELFKKAKEQSPCIIFIDEIDAIGKSRDNNVGGHDEREQTLNQLLTEMDGFDNSKAIVILGATNRPEVLDKALLRPGRFDRQINVEKPDLKGREDIFRVHLKGVKYDPNINIKKVALATVGAAGADIANIVNEAAIRAVRHGRKILNQEDILESIEVIFVGKEKKDRVLSEHERKLVAYHEVGHALTSALQKNSKPVQKITIIPRTMGALGYTLNMPEEEKYLKTKEELLAEIVVFLGGRAAEDVVFNCVTTGASNDIERSTRIARAMVTMYGMSDTFGLMGIERTQNQYLGGNRVSECADQTIAGVDQEVRGIMADAYEQAKNILIEYRDALDEISEYLLGKETIDGDEFMNILVKYKPDIKMEKEEVEQLTIDGFLAKGEMAKIIDVEVNDDTKTSEEASNQTSDETTKVVLEKVTTDTENDINKDINKDSNAEVTITETTVDTTIENEEVKNVILEKATKIEVSENFEELNK